MTKDQNKEFPALQNEDVTGMTEERQEKVIRESGQAPREEAAKEFYDEQEVQAGETSPEERARQDADRGRTAS